MSENDCKLCIHLSSSTDFLQHFFLMIFTFGRHRRKLSVSSKSPAGERPQSWNPIKHLIKEHWRSTCILFRFWKSIHLRKERIERHPTFDLLLSTEYRRSTYVKARIQSIDYFQQNTVDWLHLTHKTNVRHRYNRKWRKFCAND